MSKYWSSEQFLRLGYKESLFEGYKARNNKREPLVKSLNAENAAIREEAKLQSALDMKSQGLISTLTK